MRAEALSKFIKNYTSLMAKVDKEEIGSVVRFCTLFQSDNIDLYNRYKDSQEEVEDIINLYAECYGFDPEKDIEEIMWKFFRNTVEEGVVYHLNSSANLESIMTNGLGTSSIGIKTPERQDYEKLESLLPQKTFEKLLPFHGEKSGSRVYYSCKPMLYASYGKMPEWIRKLKENAWVFDYPDEFEVSDEARNFIDEILEKYNNKYSDSKRMLFVLPLLEEKITEEDIKRMLANESPLEIMRYMDLLLQEADEYYIGHVSPANIIAIDLEICNLHLIGEDGQKEKIDLDILSSAIEATKDGTRESTLEAQITTIEETQQEKEVGNRSEHQQHNH